MYVFVLCSRIEGDQFGVPSIQELRQYQIVVATLSTARALALMGLPKGHFTHIFIDEAAQVGPPSLHHSLPPSALPPPLSPSLRPPSLIYCFVYSIIIGLYSGYGVIMGGGREYIFDFVP